MADRDAPGYRKEGWITADPRVEYPCRGWTRAERRRHPPYRTRARWIAANERAVPFLMKKIQRIVAAEAALTLAILKGGKRAAQG